MYRAHSKLIVSVPASQRQELLSLCLRGTGRWRYDPNRDRQQDVIFTELRLGLESDLYQVSLRNMSRSEFVEMTTKIPWCSLKLTILSDAVPDEGRAARKPARGRLRVPSAKGL